MLKLSPGAPLILEENDCLEARFTSYDLGAYIADNMHDATRPMQNCFFMICFKQLATH